VGWIVWIVGTIAATCTAFYMTRLMAMTFWGKEKFLAPPAGGEADEAHASAFDKGLARHDAKTKSAGDRPRHEPGEHVGQVDHGASAHHVHIPHESPRSMWVPLAALAVLATIGGFVGITTAFTGGKHVGGRMNIVNFLDPIIWNPSTSYFGTHEIVDSYGKPLAHGEVTFGELGNTEVEPVEAPPPYGSEGFNLAHAVESKVHSETLTEWVFILISLLVAGLGIFLGYLFYLKDTRLPDIWAARLRPLYQASYNKYWVDEFFGWAVTRRVMDAARGVFAFDSKVVDGGVNGTAWLTRFSSRVTGFTDQYFVDGIVNAVAGFVMRLMSPLFRAAQTGLTQNYALVMVLGLVAAVAVIFGADIMGWLRH
jgi:NADH-quinone oxidoreductase subunit L